MRKKIQPVVLAAIKKGDRYLLTQRAVLDPEDNQTYKDAWQTPGGGINFGETPEQALVREVKEETGLDVEIVSFVPHIFTEVRTSWQGIFLYFICELKNEHQEVKLDHESSGDGWYTVEEVKTLKTMPDLYNQLSTIDKFNSSL